MNFDRREWLAIIAAGTAKLLGVPGKAMAELPEDDGESLFTRCSDTGPYCDDCGFKFPTSALRYHQLDGNPSVQLCFNCHDYYQSWGLHWR